MRQKWIWTDWGVMVKYSVVEGNMGSHSEANNVEHEHNPEFM